METVEGFNNCRAFSESKKTSPVTEIRFFPRQRFFAESQFREGKKAGNADNFIISEGSIRTCDIARSLGQRLKAQLFLKLLLNGFCLGDGFWIEKLFDIFETGQGRFPFLPANKCLFQDVENKKLNFPQLFQVFGKRVDDYHSATGLKKKLFLKQRLIYLIACFSKRRIFFS